MEFLSTHFVRCGRGESKLCKWVQFDESENKECDVMGVGAKSAVALGLKQLKLKLPQEFTEMKPPNTSGLMEKCSHVGCSDLSMPPMHSELLAWKL